MVGVLAAGFVVVLWYLMVFSGIRNDISDTEKKTAAAKRETSDLDRQKRTLQSLEDHGPELQSRLEQLRQAVPAQPDLASFIDAANAIGAEAGVTWVSVTPAPPTTTGAVGTIQMSIEVNGGYFQVLDYLNKFEDLSRLVVTDTIDLTTETEAASGDTSASAGSTFGNGGAPSLSATLTARMFTQSSGGAVPGATGTTPTTAPIPDASATSLDGEG